MDIQQIKQLIKIVEKSDIGELELIEEGRKIRISKSSKLPANGGVPAPVYMPPPVQAGVPDAPAAPVAAEAAAQPADSDKYHEVLSPMVGTFYGAPSPDADPYVEVGHSVSPGTPLCIIEAMKLMNEIQSEHKGRIAKIMVENGQPVEYNQVLFLIEK